MARLPNVQGVRPVARPSRAIASISPGAASAVGRAVEGIGNSVTAFGEVVHEREATALATERDTMIADELRDLIYNPETGFAGLRGQAAVSARPEFMEKVEDLRSRANEGLNNTAQQKLESSLNRRIEGALNSIERQTLQERESWLDGASAARVQSAYQDALFNPADTAAALRTIESETRAEGLRKGWGAEQTSVALEARRSEVFTQQVKRIAASDPIAAMEHLRNNQDRMIPSDIASLEAVLQPEIKRAVGRRMGEAAARGRVDPASFDWSRYAVGGAAARSDSFTGLDPEYASRVAQMLTAADAELGPGALKITSAYRSVEKQAELYQAAIRKYGSEAAARKWVAPPGRSRHNSGTAVDFAGAGGGLLRDANSREAKWIKENAARFGLDVPMEWEPWQVEMAGSRGQPVADAPGLNGPAGIDDLLEIEDPIERDAALEEYDLRTSIAAGQRKAQLASAQDAAFQMIEAGGSLDELPLEFKQSLGQSAMTSLRSYQKTIAAGDVVETDPATYYDLRQMQANDPAKFRSQNLLEYRDKLDDADWQKMVDAQTKPASNVTGRAASTLMTTANRQLSAAGIDTSPKPGSDHAAMIASLQGSLVRWQDDFIAQNNRAPSMTEMDERISMELVPVVIKGPAWMGDNQSGPAVSINYEGDSPLADDDMDLEEFFGSYVEIRETEVSETNKVLAAQVLEAQLGRLPTPKEVVSYLIEQGLY